MFHTVRAYNQLAGQASQLIIGKSGQSILVFETPGFHEHTPWSE